MDSCRALEGEGFKITYLPVGQNGIINLKDLEEALTPETSLVSIMTVNNEIGNMHNKCIFFAAQRKLLIIFIKTIIFRSQTTNCRNRSNM